MGNNKRPRLEVTKSNFESMIFFSPDGCWLWIGALTQSGYGKWPMNRTDKVRPAHRLSYTLYKGEIPTGLHVCHSCDVRCCVNPDHLFLGTHQDNMRDMTLKKRHNPLRGSLNSFALITEAQASHIKGLLSIGLQPTLISKCMSIGLYIVQNIRRGAWKHAPTPRIYGEAKVIKACNYHSYKMGKTTNQWRERKA